MPLVATFGLAALVAVESIPAMHHSSLPAASYFNIFAAPTVVRMASIGRSSIVVGINFFSATAGMRAQRT